MAMQQAEPRYPSTVRSTRVRSRLETHRMSGAPTKLRRMTTWRLRPGSLLRARCIAIGPRVDRGRVLVQSLLHARVWELRRLARTMLDPLTRVGTQDARCLAHEPFRQLEWMRSGGV